MNFLIMLEFYQIFVLFLLYKNQILYDLAASSDIIQV